MQKEAEASPAQDPSQGDTEVSEFTGEPSLEGADGTSTSKLLSAEQVAWVSRAVPMERRARVWSRLYDSSEDGLSLTNFVFKIRQVKHTLIIVRDTEGHVFAMYNGDKWLDPSDLKEHFARKAGGGGGGARGKQDQNFYGEGNCALLAVAPTREVFLPTKADANYLHLQTAWPEAERNGVAMGGLVWRGVQHTISEIYNLCVNLIFS